MMLNKTMCALIVAVMAFSNVAVDAATQVAQQESSRRPGDGGLRDGDAANRVHEVVDPIVASMSGLFGGFGQPDPSDRQWGTSTPPFAATGAESRRWGTSTPPTFVPPRLRNLRA
ncbi:hypothetical protein PHYBOEH_009441 [Phytophthora boehmeriae]|uniref:RxLR effector protein n=1 Tax=Phytophthora boehmeriae TaxID=109152 RepID=A0A8T1VT74_9STRA|nr:hypothetical protein PHYBOEH_009441 [Phytophthora boehmeriae]